MRKSVTNPNVPLMKYEIREVVDVVQKLKEVDPSFEFIGENIGDPIVKGWRVPAFLKQIITEEVQREGDAVFGYAHSRGNPAVRKWVAEYSRKFSPSSTLDYEYVLFTNGLGAAIAGLYHMVPHGARILQPAPTYPSHASMESFNAGAPPIVYHLNPRKGWLPDLDHMESQIRAHPDIAGLLLINPNNPTGAVYDADTLERVVKLAEKYQLMILSDEIYFRMVYNGARFVQLTEIAHNRVPLIVMRGLSKDVPWPGGRSGWVEFHNTHLDQDYLNFCEAVKKRILLEVCSVHLPQVVLPRFYDHPEFEEWNRNYNAELERNGNSIAEVLEATKGLTVNRTRGAFYMMPLFDEGILNNKQTLPIANAAIRNIIEQEVSKPNTAPDKRFALYLLGATGICVVPATGFYCAHSGFRITTLERNEQKRKNTYDKLSASVSQYLNS
jgi:alanine-synthesizing transaminase